MNEKEKVFSKIHSLLNSLTITINKTDDTRPWGGFFVIEELEAEKFINYFFPTLDKNKLLTGKLSPKILLLQPNKKLSWQYHHRRSEIWKLVEGEAGIIRSDTDVEGEQQQMIKDEIVELKKGERHRLVGQNQWGIIAEIWIHTDVENPSNEDDIIRIQDDFGR